MPPRPQPGREFVLTLSCPDRAGLVHAVTGFLVRHSGNILESRQFDDRLQERFFMRVHFEVPDPGTQLETLRYGFAAVAEEYRITCQMRDALTVALSLSGSQQSGYFGPDGPSLHQSVRASA
jgi:formyltetrahydrofolate deformylase